MQKNFDSFSEILEQPCSVELQLNESIVENDSLVNGEISSQVLSEVPHERDFSKQVLAETEHIKTRVFQQLKEDARFHIVNFSVSMIENFVFKVIVTLLKKFGHFFIKFSPYFPVVLHILTASDEIPSSPDDGDEF